VICGSRYNQIQPEMFGIVAEQRLQRESFVFFSVAEGRTGLKFAQQ
jgi:hypothetical protein